MSAIHFGDAGTLFTGADGEIKQHCAAIVAAYKRYMKSRGGLLENYNKACIAIERRAELVAPIMTMTLPGMQAKAEALLPLAEVGMAGYGHRILAASLARDVIAWEACDHE